MKSFVIFIFVLLLAVPCAAQDDEVVRVKANLVNIDVLVKTRKASTSPI